MNKNNQSKSRQRTYIGKKKKKTVKCVKKHGHENVLYLSTLMWSFISLVLYNLKVDFLKIYILNI